MTLSLSKVKDVYFDQLFHSQRHGDGVKSHNSNSGGGDGFGEVEQKRPKVLLLDNYTTAVVSMCYTQSQLLSNDVILIELIGSFKHLSSMKNVDCIVYIKPCTESIQSLLKELKAPHYKTYNLYFNNTVSKNQIEQLAEADEYEVIEKVIELFQDYSILNNELFLIKPEKNVANPVLSEAESLTSLLLALKKTPLIKYESNSIDLKRLSSEILYNINSNSNNNLFDDLNRHSDIPPILLLLDRKNDSITPLITPWTYQSMINEFLNIEKNVVKLPPDNQVILSQDDQFFKESMYLNYGDLTDKFQKYVEKYKTETKQSSIENLKSQNLSDLKKILTKFPEYKKFSVNILTHLNLISEIDEQISRQSLWEIGELQQTIICDLDQQSNIKQKLVEILESKKYLTEHKIKLVLLYSHRFHNPTDLSLFISKLNDPTFTIPSPTMNQLELLKKFTTLFRTNDIAAGQKHHSQQQGLTNLFANKRVNINNIFNRHSNATTNDNIYLQYTPRLNEILASLISPETQSSQTFLATLIPDKVKSQYGNNTDYSARDIIVYIKGGVTYEESRLVHELSANNNKVSIIIGGDEVVNSSSWLNKMCNMVSRNEDQEQASSPTTAQDRQELLREVL
ncbi:VPS45 [Candida oxycetoniae]|uniref:VPS45 n=1 Tax=Candida oxycetoniae TaxID=497107 RepID=A0AAI9SUK1_9ASCO|nr:VPS45 [Candida oxycetoniae]KAI3403108.2 VPS45 [Candida oxycetoniae]